MLAGAFVGAFLGANASASSIQSSPIVGIVVIGGAAVLGAMVAFGLTMRDMVEHQRQVGEPVSRVALILFGSRFLSLAIWCSFITFAIILGLFVFALATKK